MEMMTRGGQFTAGVLLALVASCATEPPATATGEIASVEVVETLLRTEIVALDATGAPIASLVLENGPFVMEEDGRAVVGRRMTLSANGQEALHESEGFGALSLPLFNQPAMLPLRELVLDARVAEVLARQHIGFMPRPMLVGVVGEQPRETAQYTCTYSNGSACGVTSCAQGTYQTYSESTCSTNGEYQAACCGSTKRAVERWCGAGSGNPCGPEGSNGCAGCWNLPYTTSCTTGATGTQVYCDGYPWAVLDLPWNAFN